MKLINKPTSIVPALELRQKLRFMNRNDLRDRLDLDDNALLDQQVDAIGNVQYKTVVLHGLQNFATNGESSLPQLVRKAYLIGRLQQSWSQYRMNLDGGVDDLPTYVIDVHAANNALFTSGGRHGARVSGSSLRLCAPSAAPRQKATSDSSKQRLPPTQ